ncbi:four-carbon acid sugar kinase family protein [Lactobacillus xylocopicola]|uniref:Four-carbon acid sugar kinase family protein n=1 Tax=Lactobacillus xylocopicola TaxID=2976676 RepID=A0ABM8BI33_9LACO|nr:four-carbon acid sugar kinase family protein [Lactobacillus xylocopicola]BDR60952.1 hypothetical protein KIM322_12130 [Lactobacillus xylocopicola]
MKLIIVADDLTGANVSNSLLAKNGLKVGSIDTLDKVEQYRDYDALGFHTDSRGDEPQVAYQKVYDYTEKLKNKNVRFYNKRIDSTLRGNLGAEIDGMLDALGDNYTAMVVPAFPSSGKIVVGNFELVDGVMLEQTDAKNDPTSPVTNSRVAEILQKQSSKSIGIISMESILEGVDSVKSTIKALITNGARVIMFDACTEADIDTIAAAVIGAEVPFISVDPGPFTNSLMKDLNTPQSYKEKKKSLYVIGSVSGIVAEQIAQFKAALDPFIFQPNARKFLYEDQRNDEIARAVASVVENLESNAHFLIATMIQKKDKLDLKKEARAAGLSVAAASNLICESMAEIGAQIVDQSQNKIGGVYTSGGDITKAFLEQNKAQGIEIKDEIIPLAVYGRVMGGRLDNMPVITKGGLIGDKTTLVECANYLSTKISNTFVEEKK